MKRFELFFKRMLAVELFCTLALSSLLGVIQIVEWLK